MPIAAHSPAVIGFRAAFGPSRRTNDSATRLAAPASAPALLVLLLSILLSACAGGPVISADERYDGQVAAGVVQPAGVSGDRVQRRLIAALEQSGDFAGVYPLYAPGQYSEVEVVITPSILDTRRGAHGLEQLLLQIHASRRPPSAGVLDKTYRGTASGRADALDDLIPSLTQDLGRRFGAKPIY